jgi:hypothetical protein
MIEGKPRLLHLSSATDAVVERLVAQWLGSLVEPLLSARLYSYRSGFSALRAVRELERYIRGYRRSTPAVRERSLWLLRRDIRDYGESIPVVARSTIWGSIDRALAPIAPAIARSGRELLRQMLARHCRGAEAEYCLTIGTPTGSAIQPLINNLYLADVDHQMAALNGFYARFGDDMLFVTPSREIAERARSILSEAVEALGLGFNARKSRDIYLTGAARAAPTAGWTAAAQFDYLGLSLAFRGGTSLPRAKWRRLLHLLDRRLGRLGRAMRDRPEEEAAAALAQLVRCSLDPSDPVALPYADLLSSVVDDRQQLRDLDEWLRRKTATLSSGKAGVRALRVLPPARLYELGLPSVTARRNGARS